MKKITYLLLILCFFQIFSCATTKKVIKQKAVQPERIVLLLQVDENTKINTSFLPPSFLDQTSDFIVKSENPALIILEDETTDNLLISSSDATSDVTTKASHKKNESKDKKIYITNPKLLDYYTLLFTKQRDSIERLMFSHFRKNSLNIELYRSKNDILNPTDLLFDIRIRNYQEGEFNLIRNRNTQIYYEVIISDGLQKNIANFNKKYIVKTNYNLPLEIGRLNKVNEQFTSELFDFSKRIIKKNVSRKVKTELEEEQIEE